MCALGFLGSKWNVGSKSGRGRSMGEKILELVMFQSWPHWCQSKRGFVIIRSYQDDSKGASWDASHKTKINFQGQAVPTYVEILPLTNLNIWVLFICKSHYGINVFIFKWEHWRRSYLSSFSLRINESHPHYICLPILYRQWGAG